MPAQPSPHVAVYGETNDEPAGGDPDNVPLYDLVELAWEEGVCDEDPECEPPLADSDESGLQREGDDADEVFVDSHHVDETTETAPGLLDYLLE